MGKKLSTTLVVIGVILVAAAIVWWAVIAPMLVKLPDDIDTQMVFDGDLTLYIDSETGAPIAEDQAEPEELTADRSFAAVPDLFTSSVAVFEDTVTLTTKGQVGEPQLTRYALDRSSRECVDSTENWAYSPEITVNRTGNYGALFPGGLKVGDTVPVFFNDPSKVFNVTVAESIDDWNGLGITALRIDGTRPSADYNPAIQEAFLVETLGLPSEITFDQLAAQLKDKGLDLEALLTALASIADPEDLQALQALTQEPVKLVYNQNSADVFYIEQKTGATVGATFDRTTTMKPDSSGLLGAFAILGKYTDDPALGSSIQSAMDAGMELSKSEPTKIYNQKMSIVETGPGSQEELAQSAKDKIPLLNLVDLWIPVIIVVLGGIAFVIGAIGLLTKSRKAAA